MNSYTRIKNNINTAEVHTLLADPLNLQIAEVVSREELSVQEIAEMVHADTKKVSEDIQLLIKAHVIKPLVRSHRKVYAVAESSLAQTIHILYGLWSDSILSPKVPAQIRI